MKIAIIGGGSAGMTAAHRLMTDGTHDVTLFEKGNPIRTRNRKEVMSGFGGAGAFSDGKLTLTTEYGGWLTDYMPEEELEDLIEQADDIWREISGVDTLDSSGNYEETRDLQYLCSRHKLRLYPAKIRHLGTDNCLLFVERMYDLLEAAENVRLACNTDVVDLKVEDGTVTGLVVRDANGERTESFDRIICAVGRSGNAWMQSMVEKYDIDSQTNPVDIGVRVEVPRSITDHFTDKLYEFKIKYFTTDFEDEVRTFCVNPGGFMAVEQNENNLKTVNGHSYKNKKSENTNFALLVSTKFTEPFKEPVKYGQYIAYLANMLGGNNVIVQRFGDLQRGRRSTEKRIEKNFVRPTMKTALPGDLSFVLPYRHLADIRETILQLDNVMPGMADPNTLLYGVEVKFYSLRIKVDRTMKSDSLAHFYCTGDGAGITRGIIQASVSGLIAAEDIISG